MGKSFLRTSHTGGFFLAMSKETQKIIPEVSHPLIGTDLYPAERDFSRKTLLFTANRALLVPTPKLAEELSFKLRNNSEKSEQFGNDRPKSAYFSYNPHRASVMIEWGEIAADGTAQLHDFLNREINPTQRDNQGWTVRSGHIGNIRFPHAEEPVPVALFDSIARTREITPQEAEYPIVLTLINNNIIPIGSDGYPVQISRTKHYD